MGAMKYRMVLRKIPVLLNFITSSAATCYLEDDERRTRASPSQATCLNSPSRHWLHWPLLRLWHNLNGPSSLPRPSYFHCKPLKLPCHAIEALVLHIVLRE